MYMYMYVKCVHVYVGGLCTECSGFSGTLFQVLLQDSDCFLVQPNDRLGFAQRVTDVPLRSMIEQNNVRYTQFYTPPDNASLPRLGDRVPVESIRLPTVFALAALVDQGASAAVSVSASSSASASSTL